MTRRRLLKECAAKLGNDDVLSLAAEVAALCAWLIANKDKMSEAVALEVATALLLLENALANFDGLGAEFSQQSQLICARLRACVAGKLLRTQPEIQLLDEMSRKAQERLLMSQVVSEMQANLRAIEQALDAFFRDSARRDGLKALDTPLKQVLGALDMLGEERARDTLGAADLDIRRFADARYEPSQKDFERIAQTLSGLGFYIEALAHGKADFDAAMRPIAAAKPAADADVSQPVATFEAQLAEQKRETASLYEEWKKAPEDAALKAELQKNLAALQQDAGLVADQTLESQAQNALRVLEATAAWCRRSRSSPTRSERSPRRLPRRRPRPRRPSSSMQAPRPSMPSCSVSTSRRPTRSSRRSGITWRRCARSTPTRTR